jgi:hypothetical protein
MDIKEIIREEIAKYLNNKSGDMVDAFVDNEHTQIDMLPNGEMILSLD